MTDFNQIIAEELKNVTDELNGISRFLNQTEYSSDRFPREEEFVRFYRRYLTNFKKDWCLSFQNEFQDIISSFYIFRHCLDDGYVSIVPSATPMTKLEDYAQFVSTFTYLDTFERYSGNYFAVAGETDFFRKSPRRDEEQERSKEELKNLVSDPNNFSYESYNAHYINSGVWKSGITPIFIPGEINHCDVITTNDFKVMNEILDWLEAKEKYHACLRSEVPELMKRFT